MAERSRLPQKLSSPQDNLFLAQPDKLVVTASDGGELLETTKQLMSVPLQAALQVARSAVNVTGQLAVVSSGES